MYTILPALFLFLIFGAADTDANPLSSVALLRQNNPNSADIPDYTFDELWKLQVKFWDAFMYPANVKQVESINSTIFTEDVQGRVDATRPFIGRELNTEYIFGLFIPTDSLSIIGQPISYNITAFAANQNIVSSSTRVQFNFTNFGLIAPVTIDTWLAWDASGQISQYDVSFRWFGYMLQTLVQATLPVLTAKNETLPQLLAASVCNTHANSCNGTNTQYASNDDCMDFLLQETRLGQSWELGMNTLLCRSLHQIMLKYRPDVHCPHIGKTGGDMCVDDYTYESKVMENLYTNYPFVPYGYST